ncbi:M23 family metallopeptidase [Bacillus timonensis]|nr:M23 family metallopeptidase [Bacillus timonensis]
MNKTSKLKINEYINKFNPRSILKKTMLTTVAVGMLAFGTASAESSISTVYHVYVDGERIGTVDNKDIIEKVVKGKIDTIKEENKEYKDVNIVVSDLSYIPEQVFRSYANNMKTAKLVADRVGIVAKASAIVVNDEPVAYLGTEEEANNVLEQLKLKYVSAEVLTELETRKKSGVKLAPLQKGESRIIDVKLAEKVSISEGKITPDKILSVEDTLNLLLKGTLEEKLYTVQEGDVLGSIAIAHDLSTAELLSLNPGLTEESLIKIGDELNVTAYKPFVTVVVTEETYKSEEIAFEVEVKESSSMFKGDKKVQQKGQKGEKLVNYIVEKSNGIQTSKTATSETIVTQPVTEVILKGTKVVPSRGTGSLAWPTVGGYISSHMGHRWGQMHKGIDIARPSSRTIKAADNGTVVSAGWDGGYGNKIVIDHNNGLRTVYAHLSSFSVRVGQTVSKGQAIGVMGSTGNSTGVHLHFEVYKNGSLQNPMNYLR